jgi:hypothetical protein
MGGNPHKFHGIAKNLLISLGQCHCKKRVRQFGTKPTIEVNIQEP